MCSTLAGISNHDIAMQAIQVAALGCKTLDKACGCEDLQEESTFDIEPAKGACERVSEEIKPEKKEERGERQEAGVIRFRRSQR